MKFGTTQTGELVERIVISGGGLTAGIITFGAILQDVRLDGHAAPLMLGYDTFDGYRDNINYFGAVVGRHANRIRDGRFEIAGTSYRIDDAQPQAHGLHGGTGGFARRNWTLAGYGDDFVTLSLSDRDGTMGFPGTVEVKCTYHLRGSGILSVELSATTDQPTLCNLAHHAYFNLDDGGATDIGRHLLKLNADAYLPVDGGLIPTGEVLPVDGTPYDFRKPRPIRSDPASAPVLYDNNFCLAATRGALKQAAWAKGTSSGVEMELWTTEPGIQFYSGHMTASDRPGLDGIAYRPSAGFCLEPQVWPDSPHKPYFPQAILRPDEVYRQTTEFRFRRS